MMRISGNLSAAERLRTVLAGAALLGMAVAWLPVANAQYASRVLKPADVFDTSKRVIYQDDFRGDFRKWTLSIDALYDPAARPLISDRVTSEAVPGLSGRLAAKFTLPGTPGAFRSELAIPAEEGLQERWYGARIAVDQITDQAGYIVLQWHAVMGKDKVNRNFPNLAIHQKGDKWVVARAWGTPANIQRATTELPGSVAPDTLTNWVIHAKWATDTQGLIEIWKDGELVYQQKGQNAYNLSVDRTPYLKTGIYRPSRKDSTTAESPIVVRVSDVRIGRADAGYLEVSPVVTGTLEKWNGNRRTGSLLFPIDFGREVATGTVGFIVPQQAGVAGGPASLVWSARFTDRSSLSVALTNRLDGKSRNVTLRGYRHNGCTYRAMHVASDCRNRKNSRLEIFFDREDNRDLAAGLYEGKLFVEARGWKDTAYRRSIEVNIRIFVSGKWGELRPGTLTSFRDLDDQVKQGAVAFVVPSQYGVQGPASMISSQAAQDTKLTVTVTDQAGGARYPVVVRARRITGECGKVRMNSTFPCGGYGKQSDLELEYRPSDNPDLPPGQFAGALFVLAQGTYESWFQEPLALGLIVKK
jgi:Polysaccharide lyase